MFQNDVAGLTQNQNLTKLIQIWMGLEFKPILSLQPNQITIKLFRSAEEDYDVVCPTHSFHFRYYRLLRHIGVAAVSSIFNVLTLSSPQLKNPLFYSHIFQFALPFPSPTLFPEKITFIFIKYIHWENWPTKPKAKFEAQIQDRESLRRHNSSDRKKRDPFSRIPISRVSSFVADGKSEPFKRGSENRIEWPRKGRERLTLPYSMT